MFASAATDYCSDLLRPGRTCRSLGGGGGVVLRLPGSRPKLSMASDRSMHGAVVISYTLPTAKRDEVVRPAWCGTVLDSLTTCTNH